MNHEQAEHRIFVIIRRVCAKHDIDIGLHTEQSEDDDGRLHVTIDYLRSRRSKLRRLLANSGVGLAIGNAIGCFVANESDAMITLAMTLVLCASILWHGAFGVPIYPFDRLQEEIQRELEAAGYEVGDDPVLKERVVRW